MAQLLLELFSEEIPSGAQVNAQSDLRRIFTEKFASSGIACDNVECYTTPRRITIVTNDLPTFSQASEEERRGPRTDAPEQAIAGFLKVTGLAIEQLEKRQTPKGEFYFAVIKQEAKPVSAMLVDIIQDIISSYTWSKSMKWGSYGIRWIRPLHSILCLFDGDVLPVEFGHIKSGNVTRGHRFLGNSEFSVKDFADYEAKLRECYVILKPIERQEIIAKDAATLAHNNNLLLKEDEALLAEVANLVEWPVVLIGKIEEKFMHVPQEVLVLTMRSHQRYFALLRKDGALANYFITVSNIISNDNGVQIINGNERVLRARLEDAKFFWDQDRKNSLESRVLGLEKVVFHARLGTVAQKVQRIMSLAKFIAGFIPSANVGMVERAAKLCKADLATGMVGELPELQGIMGGYYAAQSNEPNEVSLAIKEHYSPVGASDIAPSAPTSVAVAIADKVDSLVGLFAIDEKPTGSRDPYALRRAALGVIRIILENKLRLPLREIFKNSADEFFHITTGTKQVANSAAQGQEDYSKKLSDELMIFFGERLRASMKEQNIRHDIIAAVLNDGGEDDFTKLVNKAAALSAFLATEDGINLLAAYKRATNIVQIEEKKDKIYYSGKPSDALMVEDSEREIFSLFNKLEPMIADGLQREDFALVMGHLASFRNPVDKFFENVKVNCEDASLRRNRLLLLSGFRDFLNKVADFSKLEG